MRGNLVHSHYSPPESLEGAVGGVGTYRCGSCDQRPWIRKGDTCPLPRGGYLKSRTYADCRTVGVVYLATCTCAEFYIGKTKRTFAR